MLSKFDSTFQFADKVCKLDRVREMRIFLTKNERRCTRVQQSKFFVKALENTIKIHIPYIKEIELQICNEAQFLFYYFLSRA